MYSLYRGWLAPEPSHVLINVGSGPASRQFLGHKAVLAEHSGYIKSLLAQGTPEISVPNVSPEVFTPLLTFMYTGYLDLNADNVYAVLLATHLLHMPRAVDVCRSYLLHRQLPPLVKPVPSRLYWPLPPPPYPLYPVAPPPPTTPPPPRASTSRVSPPPVASPACSDAAVSVTEAPTPPPPEPKPASKVVTDVACCDGPVRFKRVLNTNYGADRDDSGSGEAAEKRFVCHYCKHTFKSHYCYRKHTRRHINPVPAQGSSEDLTLLDMNVQYYPCKTCGSKFPSYYFVHKHRKMCHPERSSPPISTTSTPSTTSDKT